MNWLPIALLTAFSLATADALSKKALSRTEDLVIVWVREGYAVPFLALGFLFIDIPGLDAYFWASVAALLPLEIIALILYVKAIRVSPLSLTVPFMALSPVFIILTAFVFLGEWPSSTGALGILLIAAGAYLLNAGASSAGVLGPIKAIWKEPGSVLMIIVAFIYSVTSTLGKVAIQHSDPVFFGFFYPFILAVILSFLLFSKGKLRLVASRPATFLAIGFFTASMVITHFIALNMTQVAYMISVKRTSLLFSVLYGHFIFGEEKVRERLLGSALMAAGVAVIAIF